MNITRSEPAQLLVIVFVAVLISGLAPYDRIIWLLEVAPVLIAIPILFATYGRCPLTPLAYRLLLCHALILIIGAHYTYARVPPGLWLQEALELSRNHYDRLGHLAQGFVPAIVAREVLIRWSPLKPGKWLFFLVLTVCLAISASYEMIEWWVALLGDDSAAAFLGTQGDIWDTQWDMFLALIGAFSAQLVLARLHDRQLRAMAIPGPL